MYTELSATSGHATEAAAVADLAHAADLSEALAEQGLALVPKTHAVQDLDQYAEKPRRAKAAVTLTTVRAFSRYFERFGLHTELEGPSATAAVFADPEEGRYAAVLDYHSADGPAHGDHRATLQLAKAEAWETWTTKASQRMGQTEFALFVEARLDDIAEPESASVLEAVTSMQAVRNATFKSRVDLDRGDVVFHYETETKGTGDVVFPERLALGLPVFVDGDPYRVEARLRYKMDDEAGLQLWYDLVNADAVLRAAADDVLASVEYIAGEGNVFVGSLR